MFCNSIAVFEPENLGKSACPFRGSNGSKCNSHGKAATSYKSALVPHLELIARDQGCTAVPVHAEKPASEIERPPQLLGADPLVLADLRRLVAPRALRTIETDNDRATRHCHLLRQRAFPSEPRSLALAAFPLALAYLFPAVLALSLGQRRPAVSRQPLGGRIRRQPLATVLPVDCPATASPRPPKVHARHFHPSGLLQACLGPCLGR